MTVSLNGEKDIQRVWTSKAHIPSPQHCWFESQCSSGSPLLVRMYVLARLLLAVSPEGAHYMSPLLPAAREETPQISPG